MGRRLPLHMIIARPFLSRQLAAPSSTQSQRWCSMASLVRLLEGFSDLRATLSKLNAKPFTLRCRGAPQLSRCFWVELKVKILKFLRADWSENKPVVYYKPADAQSVRTFVLRGFHTRWGGMEWFCSDGLFLKWMSGASPRDLLRVSDSRRI